ncbi:MAG: glycosyltransferase family 2 protein [Chloroflexota bacterium]
MPALSGGSSNPECSPKGVSPVLAGGPGRPEVERHPWPRISIVTPSYNQGQFIEETIRSVISQGYPNLEYIIIDGGSMDGSQTVIKKYEHQLSYWVSEPDRGMYHAINKGFEHATGDILGWINSSDMLMPWALWVVGQIFTQIPDLEWLTSLYPVRFGEQGLPVKCEKLRGHNKNLFYEGRCHIQQESTFWKKSLWLKVGGLNTEDYQFAGDFELWSRFYEHAELCGVDVPLGGNRYHNLQKNASIEYRNEYRKILNSGNIKRKVYRNIIRKLRLHEIPKIRVLVNYLAGNELHFIRSRFFGDSLKWEITSEKQFV